MQVNLRRLLCVAVPPRRLVALLALPFVWLSLSAPLEHNHDIAAPDAEALLTVSAAKGAAPTRTSIAQSAIQGSSVCVACEWQAATVGVTTAAVALRLTPPPASPFVSPRTRIADLRPLRTASRAPPVA